MREKIETWNDWTEGLAIHDGMVADLWVERTNNKEAKPVRYWVSIAVDNEDFPFDEKYIADYEYIMDEDGRVIRDDGVPRILMDELYWKADDPLVAKITSEDIHTFDKYIINNNL